jgi:hypothetical protein
MFWRVLTFRVFAKTGNGQGRRECPARAGHHHGPAAGRPSLPRAKSKGPPSRAKLGNTSVPKILLSSRAKSRDLLSPGHALEGAPSKLRLGGVFIRHRLQSVLQVSSPMPWAEALPAIPSASFRKLQLLPQTI